MNLQLTKKVKDTSSSFTSMPIQKAPPLTLTYDGLTCFSSLSSEDVLKLATSNHATTCSLDPIPSPLLQNISHDLPHFRNYSSSFQYSHCKATPKEIQDSADIRNYRSVSRLSFLSITQEHAVCNQQKMTSLTLISQPSGLVTPLRQPSSQ